MNNSLGRMDLHNSDSIVVKDCWDVFRGKLVRCIRDKQTCFTDSTVPDHNTPSSMSVSTMLCFTPIF